MKNTYKQPPLIEGVLIPSTTELEIQAIADLVGSPEVLDDARQILNDEDFSDDENRAAWVRLCDMADRGKEIDLITFKAEVGGKFLSHILDIPTSSSLETLGHCQTLAQQSRRRSIIITSLELIDTVSKTKDEDKEAELFDKLDQFRRQPGKSWQTTVFDYSAEIPQPSPLLTCGGAIIATRENLTVVTGKPKLCKTTLQSAVIAAAIQGQSILNFEAPDPLRVLVCDTEQSAYYLSKQCDRVLRMAGIEKGLREGLSVLNLRPYGPSERYALIVEAVEDLRPDLLFIDGAADLIADTNDLISSESLVSNLLTMSSKYNMGIVTIIHSNPGGDGKVRGHLGSTAERKAETVISLERDGMNDTITVKPRQTRNQPFKPFSFTLNDQGDPELVTPNDGPKTSRDWLLSLMEPGKEYRNVEIVSMMEARGFGKSATQYALGECHKKGLVAKNGNAYYIPSASDDMPDI